MEKFYSWSWHKTDALTPDELLTNIIIYWVMETANSTGRMNADNSRAVYLQTGGPNPLTYVTVVDGCGPRVKRCPVSACMGGTEGQRAALYFP
jgi:hypothetical protein